MVSMGYKNSEIIGFIPARDRRISTVWRETFNFLAMLDIVSPSITMYTLSVTYKEKVRYFHFFIDKLFNVRYTHNIPPDKRLLKAGLIGQVSLVGVLPC